MQTFDKKIIYFIAGILILGIISCGHKYDITKVKDFDKYDGPEQAARQEYERTKDPATGRVPRELLLAALDQTMQSKLSTRNNPNNINSLTWLERGPNSDATGPSNGNTRANGGVASGRIRAMMVDSTDATHKTVFVGGVDGGLWKTTDITASPANWLLVNDYLSNLAIAALCQDPRPGFGNIMYMCTGESYYNIDAVQGNGVFKSSDGGTTWTFLASSTSFLNCTRILCDYQGNVYLSTRGSGIQRSLNGGTSWTNITPTGFIDFCDMEISSTGVAGRLHVVAGIFNTQAYFYTDIPVTVASGTWTSPITAFPSFSDRAEIACKGNMLYALPSNGGSTNEVPVIYKSTDGGAHWTAATSPSPTWASGQGWYALAVDINPANPAQCIVGGLDTWKSTTSAASWTQLSTWVNTTPVNQYVHADVHKILWFDGGNKVLFASDGGIFYSGDGGLTIRDRNVGLRLKQFYSCAIHPSTTNYFLAGAQDNGVHQFSTAGLSSTVEVTGGDGAFVAIDQNQPQYQFGSYVFNDYRRSTDGGVSWSFVTLNSSSGQFINPFDYDNTANIMYCSDATSSFRRWTDPQTGSTSAVINITNLTGNVTAVDVSPYTANRVYFGTSAGKVVQVDNANTIASASAGTDRSVGLPSGTISCITQGTDNQHLIAVFANYNIINVWVSSDGGATWTGSDGNLPNMPVRWALFYPGDNTKAYIATETGVWETTLLNGAATVWTANNTFPTVRTDMLKYRPSDRTIAAATHGRGLWTTTVPSVSTPDVQFQNPAASATESTTFISGCRGYTDYTANMVILNPPTGNAIVTLAVASGATATPNVDYAITTNGSFISPSMTLTFPNGSTTPQPFTIRVYDDAAVESPENFTLNYSISGASNAQPGTSNQTFTFTINDNDAPPLASFSGNFLVGSYNANLTFSTPLRSNLQKFRLQALFTASELVTAGITSAANITSMTFRVVTKNSTQPYTGFTIGMANTLATNLGSGFLSSPLTQVYSGNYSSLVGNNLFTFTTPFAWDGTSNIVINFCFDNPAADALSDITEGNSAPLGTGISASTFSNSVIGTGCTLPAASVSDYRIHATFAASVAGKGVSTALNSSKTAYLGPNDDVYFYDGSGNVMARIKNLTAFDYGCTQVVIDRAGTTSSQFWNNSPANFLLSKTFKVIPTNATTTGSYQVTLYYNGVEVSGWQTATGQVVSSAQLVKVSNGFYVPDVTPGTPHIADVIVIGGNTGSFGSNTTITGTFTSTGFSGFGAGYPCSPLSGVLLWTGAVNTNWSNPGNWSCGFVPITTSDVQINNGLINYPVININATIKSLTLMPGATVQVNTGFKLSLQ